MKSESHRSFSHLDFTYMDSSLSGHKMCSSPQQTCALGSAAPSGPGLGPAVSRGHRPWKTPSVFLGQGPCHLLLTGRTPGRELEPAAASSSWGANLAVVSSCSCPNSWRGLRPKHGLFQVQGRPLLGFAQSTVVPAASREA